MFFIVLSTTLLILLHTFTYFYFINNFHTFLPLCSYIYLCKFTSYILLDNDRRAVETSQTFTVYFYCQILKKVHKISLVKKLTVWQLKVELENLHKLKFYLSVLLLMIKMSQSVYEKLDSYCKRAYRKFEICNLVLKYLGEKNLNCLLVFLLFTLHFFCISCSSTRMKISSQMVCKSTCVYNQVNIDQNILVMDWQIMSKRLCRSTFWERESYILVDTLPQFWLFSRHLVDFPPSGLFPAPLIVDGPLLVDLLPWCVVDITPRGWCPGRWFRFPTLLMAL